MPGAHAPSPDDENDCPRELPPLGRTTRASALVSSLLSYRAPVPALEPMPPHKMTRTVALVNSLPSTTQQDQAPS